MPDHIQYPTIILPQVAPLGTEVETIADAAEHVSLAFPVEFLQEKVVYVYATAVGGPAQLQVWVELAPSDVAAAYVALGAPTALAVTGNAIIAWTVHSRYARFIAQCPGWVSGAWVLQAVFEGKTP